MFIIIIAYIIWKAFILKNFGGKCRLNIIMDFHGAYPHLKHYWLMMAVFCFSSSFIGIWLTYKFEKWHISLAKENEFSKATEWWLIIEFFVTSLLKVFFFLKVHFVFSWVNEVVIWSHYHYFLIKLVSFDQVLISDCLLTLLVLIFLCIKLTFIWFVNTVF